MAAKLEALNDRIKTLENEIRIADEASLPKLMAERDSLLAQLSAARRLLTEGSAAKLLRG